MQIILSTLCLLLLVASCGASPKSSSPAPDNSSSGEGSGGGSGSGTGAGTGGNNSNGGGGSGSQPLRCPYEFAADPSNEAVTSTLAVLSGKFESTRGLTQERAADGSVLNYKPGFTIPYNGTAVVDLKFIYDSADSRNPSRILEKSRFSFSSVTVAPPSQARGFEGYVVLLFKGLTNGPTPSLQCAITAARVEREDGVLARKLSVLAWEYSAASGSIEPKSADAFLTPDKSPYAQNYIEQ